MGISIHSVMQLRLRKGRLRPASLADIACLLVVAVATQTSIPLHMGRIGEEHLTVGARPAAVAPTYAVLLQLLEGALELSDLLAFRANSTVQETEFRSTRDANKALGRCARFQQIAALSHLLTAAAGQHLEGFPSYAGVAHARAVREVQRRPPLLAGAVALQS